MEAKASHLYKPIEGALKDALGTEAMYELVIPINAFHGKKMTEVKAIQEAIIDWAKATAPTVPRLVSQYRVNTQARLRDGRSLRSAGALYTFAGLKAPQPGGWIFWARWGAWERLLTAPLPTSDGKCRCHVPRLSGSRTPYFPDIDHPVSGRDRQLLVVANGAGIHVPIRQDDDLALPDVNPHHEPELVAHGRVAGGDFLEPIVNLRTLPGSRVAFVHKGIEPEDIVGH